MKFIVWFPFGIFPLTDQNFPKIYKILQDYRDGLKTYTDLGCTDLFVWVFFVFNQGIIGTKRETDRF